MKRLISFTALAILLTSCQSVDTEKLVELNELSFVAPEAWDVIYYGSDDVQLKVPGDTVDFDYLYMNLTKVDYEVDTSEEMLAGEADSNLKVYDNPCGGAYDCFYLQVEADVYQTVFTTGSTELPPENLDGIWNPNVEVETQEMIDFLLTASAS